MRARRETISGEIVAVSVGSTKDGIRVRVEIDGHWVTLPLAEVEKAVSRYLIRHSASVEVTITPDNEAKWPTRFEIIED